MLSKQYEIRICGRRRVLQRFSMECSGDPCQKPMGLGHLVPQDDSGLGIAAQVRSCIVYGWCKTDGFKSIAFMVAGYSMFTSAACMETASILTPTTQFQVLEPYKLHNDDLL